MKWKLVVFSLLFWFCEINAQAVFQFTATIDTVNETDGTVLLGYIKTSQSSPVSKNYKVLYKGGTADTIDIGYFSGFSVYIPENTDSVPFSILITDDYKVEFTEYAQFVLRGATPTDSVGTDSTYTLFITDNELPATIGFSITQGTIWETQNQYFMHVVCNNPNPTDVTCYIRVDEPISTLTRGIDYYYDDRTLTFPSGYSVQSTYYWVLDDNDVEPTEFCIAKLSDFGANTITDSVFTFTVKDDDSPRPLSLSFDYTEATVWEDTTPVVPVYITINNPWNKTYSYNIYVHNGSSTTTSGDLQILHGNLNAEPGISHDTAFIKIVNDDNMEDIEQALIRIGYGSDNTTTSPDTLFTINIIDTDSARIGFLGAAISHLESEGTVAVKLVSTSTFPYSISVPVNYYNGNAVSNVDYFFSDTTVVFPAFSADTQVVFVPLFDNQYYTGTRQVNLRIGNVDPLIGRSTTGILQHSLFILDDDSIISGIADISDFVVNVYPNPFNNQLTVRSEKPIEWLKVTTLNGQTMYNPAHFEKLNAPRFSDPFSVEIPTKNWASGIYVVQLFADEKWHTLKVIKSE